MGDVCRTCLKVSDNLKYLFHDSELPHKIATISSIQVSLDDNLSTMICDQCERNVHLLYDFRSIIIRSNIILKKRQTDAINTKQQKIVNIEFDIVTIKNEESHSNDFEPNNSSYDCELSNSSKVDDNLILTTHENVQINSIDRSNYECRICKEVCVGYFNFRNHKRTHLITKSICNICGKSLRTDNMSKHIKSHTEPPVKCEVCGKMCKNTESLRGHVRIHKDVRLQCNTCGKIYTHRTGFRAHLKRHALGDIKTVACWLCDKLFYDKKFLAKHIRSHTGERPYPCEYCKKGFSSSNALKTHVRQHTNEKPYACEYCPMAFPQRVSLRTHLKSKHAKDLTDVNTVS